MGESGGVFLRGDVFGPLDSGVLLRWGEGADGEVFHEAVVRGAVPVPLSRRSVNALAWARDDCPTIAGVHYGGSLRDVEGLPMAMDVPGGARAGGESDQSNCRVSRRLGAGDGVDPHVAGESIRWSPHRRAPRIDVHQSAGSANTRFATCTADIARGHPA